MKLHNEQRVLPYTATQMFNLVADVGRYPEFLPWCTGARIREKKDDLIVADLMIGFKMVRERFTSRVHLDLQRLHIDVEYIDGPFKSLKNHWQFTDIDNGHCRIDFHLEFEFRSVMLEKLIGVLFHEAVRRMVSAFEMRAKQLYS